MKEILGDNLKRFFDAIDSKCNNADITYAGDRYEVWKVSDELFQQMCNMSEEEFVELAGEDAWWRQSEGSVLGAPEATYTIKGHRLLVWEQRDRSEWCDGCECDDEESCVECMDYSREFQSLSEYLCDEVGVSQPRNVCACAMDLAKYNGMSMGELFSKYEG